MIGKEISSKDQPATWFDFSMHFDVERDKLKSLKNEMETSLRGRSPRVIHLRHWPGAGGSTLARRLAWDLHLNYPVVRLRSGSSQHTVNRLRTVADITGSPVLILAEAADVPAGTVAWLHAEASANRLPLVFLSVQRDFGSASEGDRVVHLGRTLSNVETYRFTERPFLASTGKANCAAAPIGEREAARTYTFLFGACSL